MKDINKQYKGYNIELTEGDEKNRVWGYISQGDRCCPIKAENFTQALKTAKDAIDSSSLKMKPIMRLSISDAPI